MLHDHMELSTVQTAEIITFNTVALKGSIRDVGRGLGIPLEEVNKICEAIYQDEDKKDIIDDEWRNKYPKLFEFLDIIMGTIVSIGTHPSGVLISDLDLSEEIGICSTKESPYPVSCLNMKELDSLNFVKLDLLGLDNISLINDTCKLAGIEKLTPDNIDLEDWNVWKNIREDSTGIFQYESDFSTQILKELFSDETIKRIRDFNPNISMLKLFAFGNALLRPCGSSIRNDAVKGVVKKTGIKEIDDLLAPELGNCIIQEDLMLFFMKFCGFDLARSDKARKIIGKKLGTKQLLPEIKEGFYQNAVVKYNLSNEQAEQIINPILQCVLDASRYAFSWNHALSYSYVGYAAGWLRTYYPMEFLTTCLNVFIDKEAKTSDIIKYINSHGYKLVEPKFRYAKAEYFFDKDSKTIYKGMKSIKYLNESCANELYELRDNQYDSFVDLLYDIEEKVSINSRQLDILIKLDYFKEFGNSKELLGIVAQFDKFKSGKAKSISKDKLEKDEILYGIVERHSRETAKKFSDLDVKAILNEVEFYIKSLDIKDFTIREKMENQKEYLGYINISSGSDDIEERKKLIILDIIKYKSKIGNDIGKIWAYNIKTQSIGSGKHGSFTIKADLFNRKQLEKLDIIYAKNFFKNSKGYWYLTDYDIIDI